MGGIAGSVVDSALDKLSSYGINLGMAFQLRDDLLDSEADVYMFCRCLFTLHNFAALTQPPGRPDLCRLVICVTSPVSRS